MSRPADTFRPLDEIFADALRPTPERGLDEIMAEAVRSECASDFAEQCDDAPEATGELASADRLDRLAGDVELSRLALELLLKLAESVQQVLLLLGVHETSHSSVGGTSEATDDGVCAAAAPSSVRESFGDLYKEIRQLRADTHRLTKAVTQGCADGARP